MSRIREEKKARIIEFYLEGLPRDATAAKLRMSGETVSRHIAQFKKPLTEKAVELLEGLRLLSMELRKTRKTLPEALSIAKVHSKLEEIGVYAENVKHFIDASKKISRELGINARDYVKAAINLEKIEVETGKTYKEITRDFENKANRISQLKDEIKKLDEERDENRKALWRQQIENGLTKKDLTYASALRDALAPCGYSLKDTVKIPKLITHIQACKRDPKEVLTRLERIDNLSLTISNLEETKKEEKEELYSLKDDIEEAELRLFQLLEEIKTLEDQKKKLETEIKADEKTLTKLDKAIRLLSDEEDKMEKEIQLADCLASALLTETPINIDPLFFCASELKKAKDYHMTGLSRYRKNYEPQIKELLKDVFLSVFGHEFVTKDAYLQLQTQVDTLSEKEKTLETENIKTAAEKERLSDELKKLKEDNTRLTKKIERIVETYEEAGDRDLKFGTPTE